MNDLDMQSIMSMMQGGGNPEDMLKAMGGNNPQMAGLMPMLMNMNNRNRPTYGKAQTFKPQKEITDLTLPCGNDCGWDGDM